MSSGPVGAIKGGMAYVQAFLDDNPVTQGLAKLGTKLRIWQANLSKLGSRAYGGELPEPFAAIARFAASPAGAFSALLGAAEHTAHAREEMLRMAQTTGLTVEKFSALAYAARRAGLSNEDLAASLRKLQSREFQATLAGIGGKGAGGPNAQLIQSLGITPGMAPDEQLRKLTKEFEKLDSESRIGLAKRLGITELLPLINGGIESLDALTARAKELGLVASEHDAKAGKRFMMAWGDLKDVLNSSVSAIGGALVPAITALSNSIVRIVLPVRDWLREHKGLTQALFYATGAIVLGGLALKGFSMLAGYAAQAIGGLRTGLSLLMAPLRALAANVGGLLSGAMRGALSIVKGVLGTVWDLGKGLVSLAWQGIKIAAGAMFSLGKAAIEAGISMGGLLLATATRLGSVLLDLGGTASKVANSIVAALAGAAASALASMAALIPTVVGLAVMAAPLAMLATVAWNLAKALGAGVKGLDFVKPAKTAAQAVRGLADQVQTDFGRLREAIGGLGGYFSGWGGLAKGIFRDVSSAVLRMKDDALTAFRAFQDAMALGDLGAMGRILKDGFTIAWGEISNALAGHWDELVGGMVNALGGVWVAMRTGVAWVVMEFEKAWPKVTQGFHAVWAQVLLSISQSLAEVVGAMSKTLFQNEKKGFWDSSRMGATESLAMVAAMNQVQKVQEAIGSAAAKAGGDFTTRKKAEGQQQVANEAAEQGFAGAQEDAKKQARQWGQAGADLLKGLKPGTPQAEIDAARRDLAAQQKRLADAKAAMDAADKQKGQDDGKRFNIAGETRGTFSGAAASLMGGGGSVGERQLTAAEKANAKLDEIRRLLSINTPAELSRALQQALATP
ncbi:MAG: hypothetical protein ACLQLG_13570 [Thermoguttaceae bacterium]